MGFNKLLFYIQISHYLIQVQIVSAQMVNGELINLMVKATQKLLLLTPLGQQNIFFFYVRGAFVWIPDINWASKRILKK